MQLLQPAELSAVFLFIFRSSVQFFFAVFIIQNARLHGKKQARFALKTTKLRNIVH